MGKLRSFHIVFRNAHGVFQAGDMVRGHLYVDFSEPVKLRSISIECHGKAKVRWDKWMSWDNAGAYYVRYHAEEIYFKKELCLYGTGIGGTPVLHPSGQQRYSFEFPLPADIPSSFEGELGYVRYYCKATIERPWKFDQSAKKPFSVLHHLDLNQEAAVRAPIQFERQSPVHCCWWPLGSITATLQLQHRGFVPGQSILINAEVHNASHTAINYTKVILCQHINFYALHQGVPLSSTSKLKQNTSSRIVKCILKEGIPAGQTQVWEAEPLRIPSLPPSRLDRCKIIEIFYTVTFLVEAEWGPKLQISTEIIIGTVPLRQVITCPPSYSSVLQDRRPSSPPPPFDAEYSPNYEIFLDDIPPPTYEQSVFGHSDFQDDDEDIDQFDYTPVYAYYNWEQLRPSLLNTATHTNSWRSCSSNSSSETCQTAGRPMPDVTDPLKVLSSNNLLQPPDLMEPVLNTATLTSALTAPTTITIDREQHCPLMADSKTSGDVPETDLVMSAGGRDRNSEVWERRLARDKEYS